MKKPRMLLLAGCASLLGVSLGLAQDLPRLINPRFSAEEFFTVDFQGTVGQHYSLERSNLDSDWQRLSTFEATRAMTLQDDLREDFSSRFYRVVSVDNLDVLTGDHLSTSLGDAILHPVNHASVVVFWNGLWIYVDPVGGGAVYAAFPKADLILVTHEHGDHFNSSTLDAVRKAEAPLVVSGEIRSRLTRLQQPVAQALANGEEASLLGIKVIAVPAYNGNHPEGRGNGYILELGGRRIYFSGDTGLLEEMSVFGPLDVAFLCMNQPFTMTIQEAAEAARRLRAGWVYPYHFRNSDGSLSDLNEFRRLVSDLPEIRVRIRTWY